MGSFCWARVQPCRDKHRHRYTKHHCTERHDERRVTHTVASRCCWYNDIYSSLVPKKNGGKWKKDVIENILTSPEFTTLPVYFWRFAFDFGTLLHHLFCHSSTVIKHRDDAQDEFCIHTRAHTHTHTTRHSSVTQCHESHQCSGWVQFMSIMIELTRWIQPCVTELPPVRQMHTQTCRQKYQNNDHGSPFNSKLNVKLSGLGMSVQVQSP